MQVPIILQYQFQQRKQQNQIINITQNKTRELIIEDGCYEIADIIEALNKQSVMKLSSLIEFSYDSLKNKVSIKNTCQKEYEIIFDSSETHADHLGWMLGFKKLVFDQANNKYLVRELMGFYTPIRNSVSKYIKQRISCYILTILIRISTIKMLFKLTIQSSIYAHKYTNG